MTVADMLSKLKNAVARSKWILGGFAGIIAITGNDIYKDDVAGKRMIITYCIAGITLMAFAMVKFEKVLFEMQEKLQAHTLKKNQSLPGNIKWPPPTAFLLYMFGVLLLGMTGGSLIYITLGRPVWILYLYAGIFGALFVIYLLTVVLKWKKKKKGSAATAETKVR
jgi:hypothetical protein